MITKENCIEKILQKFPELKPDWEVYARYWDVEEILLTAHISFMTDYIVENLSKGNHKKLKEIFDYIEFLYINGNEYVQNAITTGLIEDLMNQAERNYALGYFVDFLGKECREYHDEWKKKW